MNGLYYERSEAFAHLYRLALVGAFIFLNVLTPVALAKSVSLYYPRIIAKSSTEDFKRCLYWAIALIAFLWNTFYTANSIRHHISRNKPAITSCIIHLNHPCSIPSDTNVYKDEVITLVAMIAIVPSAVFIELLVSIYAVKYFISQRSLRYGQKCNFWKHYLLQTVHVLALWNILIALQIIITTVLPLLVLLLIHPQVTFLYIVLLLMFPASLTFIAAYLLHLCLQPNRKLCCNARQCGTTVVHLVVIMAVSGLTMTLLTLYELTAQSQFETGVKGIVLSLLPSFPLSALGWYLKKRSQRRAQESPDPTPQTMTDQQSCMFLSEKCSDERLLPV